MLKGNAGWLWLCLCLAPMAAGAQESHAANAVDLAPYLRPDQFERIKISPTGEYYAVTVPLEDRTVLAIIRRSDRAITAKIGGDRDSVVDDFWWANSERVVVSMAQRLGTRDEPFVLGQLHAVNADGSRARLLASPFGTGEIGSRTEAPAPPRAVFLTDTLPGDERNVLVAAMPLTTDPYISIDRLDIYTRRRVTVAVPPVRRADFTTDQAGVVRFAHGADVDNVSRLYYREGDRADWRLINDENKTGHREFPLGFSADGSTAYLQVEQKSGPDSVVAWNPADGTYTELLRDRVVDPFRTLYDVDGRTPIGVSYVHDGVRNAFFDENGKTARFYRALERAFPGHGVYMTSITADGRLALLFVWSDRNHGDYFLFDTVEKKADRVFSTREWFDPAVVLPTRLVQMKARDGLPLYGYLTLPRDAGPQAPMVLLPHGGPFGIFDEWGFDSEAQMLAEAGYVVLRVNYRGSGNYGRAHVQAGAREWGGRMQDDLTDATRWAIDQRIADPARICIYGASYGGYAALMGAAREPDLYRCAAGYVGVYDLRLMHRRQSNRSRSGKTWAGEWMGPPEGLAERSPTTLASRIKVPVFLAAGGRDERAPLAHSERMEKALKQAGVPVETLYYRTEGHGFYTEEHRREYYTRLLAFLSRHLGGKTAR